MLPNLLKSTQNLSLLSSLHSPVHLDLELQIRLSICLLMEESSVTNMGGLTSAATLTERLGKKGQTEALHQHI